MPVSARALAVAAVSVALLVPPLVAVVAFVGEYVLPLLFLSGIVDSRSVPLYPLFRG